MIKPNAALQPSQLLKPGLSEAMQRLIERAETRKFRRSALIMQEGERADSIYVVQDGQVRIFVRSEADPERDTTLAFYGPGTLLGEMSLDGGARSASGETTQPTACWVVSLDVLRDQMARDPELSFEILNLVIRRARLATHRAQEFSQLDAYARLKKALEELAVIDQTASDGERARIDDITQSALASRVGCTREMVSRLLKDLETGGYIRREFKAIQILKRLPSRW